MTAEYVDKDAALKAVSWDTEAYTAVNMLPTADVRENVHGVWQDKGLIDCSNIHMYQCSCCGFLDTSLHAFVYSFCPWCGAEMERSEDE